MDYDNYPYNPYHTGYNKLTRNHRSSLGCYDVEHMCEGAWSYIMDDFGNAIPTPVYSHQAKLLLKSVGL